MFGLGVAALRKDLGLTQAQLAERAKLSMQFLAGIEQGEKAPSFDSIDEIARALGTTADVIFAAGAHDSPIRPPTERLLNAVKALPRRQHAAMLEVVQVVGRMLAAEHASVRERETKPTKVSAGRRSPRAK